MRDPKRIERFLQVFRKVWEQNPDQRFGQLITNILRAQGIGNMGLEFYEPTVYYTDDDMWLEMVENVAKNGF